MKEDATLLSRFVEDHAEEAFTELVQRYLAMVHATALRRVGGDAHLAQDVTQTVFIALAGGGRPPRAAPQTTRSFRSLHEPRQHVRRTAR